MPVYNGEKYVGASIQAHLEQTYEDFELILTDNGSTDQTADVCRAFTEKDPRVKYFRNAENLGAAANYRRCFELATAEYFRWTPSDDLVSPNLLERGIEVLDRDPSIFVAYGRTKLIDAGGAVIGDVEENLHLMQDRPSLRWKAVLTNLRMGNLHYGLCRTELLRKTGLLRNYGGGDIPLICEMSLYGKFYEIPDAYFYRRMHEAASSAMKNSADIMALYDPKNRKKLRMYYSSQLLDNLKSIARGPVTVSEKLRLFAFQANWAFRGRREYLRELGGLVDQAVHKLKGS